LALLPQAAVTVVIDRPEPKIPWVSRYYETYC
jgi:hypothetical protein